MSKAYFKPQSDIMGSDQPFRFFWLKSTDSATSYATNQVFITTANSSCKKQKKEMIAISKEIWGFALSKGITITAEYLPDRWNVRANWASRNFQDSSEWLISPRVFQEICVKWGFPQLDLFASRAYHQMRSYLSCEEDPHSLATDPFQQSWKHWGLMHAFPPFSMTGSSIKAQNRRGGCNSNNTKLASTTLVQSGSRIICNQTSASISVKQHLSKSSEPGTPSRREQNPKTSGLESFRQSLASEGISERAAEPIAGARRPGTS